MLLLIFGLYSTRIQNAHPCPISMKIKRIIFHSIFSLEIFSLGLKVCLEIYENCKTVLFSDKIEFLYVLTISDFIPEALDSH